MYHAELGPDNKPLYVAKKPEQKKAQQRFFFWYIPENRPWIRETLERLRMGKVSRLLLSRTQNSQEEIYLPSKDKNRKTNSAEARVGLKGRNRGNGSNRRERRR
jgi:hypothetical protein